MNCQFSTSVISVVMITSFVHQNTIIKQRSTAKYVFFVKEILKCAHLTPAVIEHV